MADPSQTNDPPTDTERDLLLKFVERLAMIMADSGLPRMPARVFAYVLADDAEIYTAGELADGLAVSPAAISGAVRYLVNAGLLAKERMPGDRRDHYRVYDDDVWGAMLRQRAPLLRRWAEGFAEGVDVLGSSRPGGRRLYEGLLFFEFMAQDMDRVIESWQEYRAERGAG
ncbi:MAG: GbsR/MarR family transcriptional regulator [Nocardioidaceae bacterium]